MNEKAIHIKSIENEKNILSYDYEIDERLNPFFHLDNKLKIEYSTDISNVPEKIAVIPFITGILPMIYLEDITLILGSDILQWNEKSWNTAKKIAQETAEKFGINTNYISSNFRFYINENALITKYRELLPVSWWYDV